MTIVNNAAMYIGVHVSFQIMVFSGYTPRSGIAESYGSSIFSFLRTSILFSTRGAPIYIPSNRVEGFLEVILKGPFPLAEMVSRSATIPSH